MTRRGETSLGTAARSLLAVLAGFLVVTFGVLSMSVWSSPVDMTLRSRGGIMATLLTTAAFLLAGFATARLAPYGRKRHVAVLAAISAFMVVITTLTEPSQTVASELGTLVLMLIGLPIGGLLGARRPR